ncbi:MAG: TIGR00730 family Rossman fold protein [Bacteroidales bacterium]
MKICVFCGSSVDLDQKYYASAAKMGSLIGKSGHSIIYGAGKIGIMGALADAARKENTYITGVIPEKLNIKGVVSEYDDKLIITKDMKTRKSLMRQKAGAFLALPGGFGTLEELMEVITLKQLQYHNKAIVILNMFGYYDTLYQHFENMYNNGFAIEDYRHLYSFQTGEEEAIKAINTYRHKHVYDKYLKQ